MSARTARRRWRAATGAFPDTRYLLYIKIGTGIDCGIVADGRLHRGAQGSAGDIGHIRVGERDDPCRCGNSGCLEAIAGGSALATRLTDLGLDATSGLDMPLGDALRCRTPRAGRS
ncbi:ROK family protein [Streptomyces sp. NPDC020681]|uniref:ROK family protein n=1 Tax=Streptomyces sp. NPDC020681 TaxID=3365083 RepID=UPI0037A65D68